MPLLRTIAETRAVVKLNFNNATSELADMSAADARFIIPVLGEDLYNELITALDVVDSGYEILIDLSRRAVGPLAYWMDLPNMQTKITDNGISTFDNDKQQAAHRWEFETLRDNLADKGCFALERMLQYVFENAGTLDWTMPDDYKLIFLTGKAFNKYYPLYQPYRTFESMRPVLRKVEDEYIKSSIGEDFFAELRDLSAEPSTEEAFAIDLLKKAAAHFTIKESIAMLPVKISTNGFTVLLAATEKEPQGEGKAPDAQLTLMHDNADRSGQNYLQRLQKYLNDNASETVFATYFSSDEYTSPATEVVNGNETRNGIFRL